MKIITFDLEAFKADDAMRRPNFVRLGGVKPWKEDPALTTDGDEIAKRVAEADVIIGHNIHAFDLPVLARWHGLDLRALRGKTIDTDTIVRLDDPPPSGKEGVAIRPKGYYGLDQSCQRYGVPAKTDDLAKLAARHVSAAKTIKKINDAEDELAFGDLPPARQAVIRSRIKGWTESVSWLSVEERAEVARLTPDATTGGKLDGYGLIPSSSRLYREYLTGDLVANEALAANRAPLNAYARREMVIGLATAQMRVNGFRVDLPELHRALDEQRDRRRRNMAELHDLTGMPLSGESPIRSTEGNAAIKKALVEQGIRESAIPITESTGMMVTGREDVTEWLDKLRSYAKGRDISRVERILGLVIAISGERTVYQTAEKTRVGDRVYPTIKATQASGRWSVTGPGLTVYGKRKGRHVERRIFLPEEDDHVLVAFDADQVDARGVAAHSGDEAYLEIFRWRGPNGEKRDLHGEVAAQLFGDKGMREHVKAISHGWNYGESVRKIAASGVPIDLATAFDQGMREMYPALVAWQDRVREQAKYGQLLDNGFGRLMRADPRYAYTQAPALVGQGTTRDIIGEALVRLPMEFWPYMRVLVHDEIVFSLPRRDWEEMSREILKAMEFDLADVTDGRLASCPITAGSSRPGLTWAECYEK